MSRKRRPLGGDQAIVAQFVADLRDEFQYPDTAGRRISNPSPQIGGGGGMMTLSIAAHNATGFSKERADYECDGSNDELVIQAALDRLTPGGLIWLSEGTFECSWRSGGVSVLSSNQSGVSIRGLGVSNTIIQVSGTPSAVDQPVFDLGGLGSSVWDLQILDNQAGATATVGVSVSNSYALVDSVLFFTRGPAIDVTSGGFGTSIRNCHFDGTANIGVRVAGGPTHIGGCEFGAGADAIQVSANANEVLVAGNTIKTTAAAGVRLEGNNDQIVISNNRILAVDGIVLEGSSHLEHVYANNIIEATQYGIHFNAAGIIGLTVEGNTLDMDASSHGIFVDGGSILAGVIASNTIRWAGDDGIRVAADLNSGGLLIDGNYIEQADHHGIHLLMGGSTGVSDCVISNNVIVSAGQDLDNTYDGIHIEDSSDRNYIHGNRILGGTSTPQMRYAVNIAAATCDCNVIVGNHFGPTADYGTDQLNDNGSATQLFYPADPTYGDNFIGCWGS